MKGDLCAAQVIVKMENDNLIEEKLQEICDIINEFQSDSWTEKQQIILNQLSDDMEFDISGFENLLADLQEKGSKIINKKNYFIRD